MPNVPQYKLPKPEPSKNTAIYCFRPGASAADKQHDMAQVNQFIDQIQIKRRKQSAVKCYDCGFICTRNYKFIDIRSEDGNQMRVAIHDTCHKRATNGGTPNYPERNN